jgi:Ca2+-binding EF-hand superfamily protein
MSTARLMAIIALTLPWMTMHLSAQVAQRRGTAAEMQFRDMDRNNDGVITRDEWTGTVQSFRTHDWNGDGVLSGEEVRVGAVQRGTGLGNRDFDPPTARQFNTWNETAFANLDHNRDGRISTDEWHYDFESFQRADRNRDGALSRAEFLGTTGFDDDRSDSFDNLDANGDGRIERREWHAGADAFNLLDRNRDGVLTRAEVLGTQGSGAVGSAGRRRGTLGQGAFGQAGTPLWDEFLSLDVNRNGRITPDEWHWSRNSFDQRDLNRDGVLTPNELSSTEDAAVATSGQLVRVDPGQRWTDTGVTVRAGDAVTISADGSIVMSTTDPNDTATPAGSRTGRRADAAPLPLAPAGALIARIGNSAPILVGDHDTLRTPVSGRLYLGVNDDHLPDNSGEYRATITVQR